MILLTFRPGPLIRLFAVAQLALPAALGVADALTAANGQGTPAHVEDTSSRDCTSAHLDECMICRQLSTGALKSPGVPPIVGHHVLAQPAAACEVNGRSTSSRGLQSRAPPHLLA